MIDIQTETVVPIAEAPQHIPGRPSLATVWRWVLNGTRAAGKLESILIGGRRFTSVEAIQRFAQQSTAAADGDATPVRTCKQRERAIEQAERELERAGI